MERNEDKDVAMVVSSQAERYAAPAALRERIVGAIRLADTAPGHKGSPQALWWLNLGAAFALGVVVSVAAMLWLGSTGKQDLLAREVVSGHVRSLMAAHLADVVSSDRHTVKPWFAGKLDFLPPVVDLAGEGFPLLGGRLDYIGGRPTAAMVYKYRQHTINVFVWRRDDRSPPPPESVAMQGFNVTAWESHDMQFWLASDLNAAELRHFATRLREEAKRSGV